MLFEPQVCLLLADHDDDVDEHHVSSDGDEFDIDDDVDDERCVQSGGDELDIDDDDDVDQHCVPGGGDKSDIDDDSVDEHPVHSDGDEFDIDIDIDFNIDIEFDININPFGERYHLEDRKTSATRRRRKFDDIHKKLNHSPASSHRAC